MSASEQTQIWIPSDSAATAMSARSKRSLHGYAGQRFSACNPGADLLTFMQPEVSRTMKTKSRIRLIALALVFAASSVPAEELVRATGLIALVPIQGVSLNMTPEAAFEHLFANGFRAGTIKRFEDWESDGIEFVRGVYGSSEGYSSLTIQRAGERIVHIAETFNAPGSPIDAEGAIGDLQKHFGITADEPKCKTTSPHAGLCQVQDAMDNPEVNLVYTMQILTTMRMVHATRTRELTGGSP